MKKGLALGIIILGMVGLVYGVVTLFNGGVGQSLAWVGTVLGLVFFSSGMGLMKSTDTSSS